MKKGRESRNTLIKRKRLGKVSLFPSTIDRSLVCMYFLGAVIPLLALGSLVEDSSLTAIGEFSRSNNPLRRAIMFGSIAVLTLLSFIILRQRALSALEENRSLAIFDPLTGLINRRFFGEQLERTIAHAKRENDRVGVCFIDLDNFTRINDTLGYDAGDELLTLVAVRIQGTLRHRDLVAQEAAEWDSLSRVGGDEFTLVLRDLSSAQDAARVAKRILDTLDEPFVIMDRDLFITASIGIAVFPSDGESTRTLLRNADSAMCSAKERGRNKYQYFSQEMNKLAKRRFDIEERLRRAIDEDQLQLSYQVLCDSRTTAINGAEVLLRWTDEELGCIAPDEFIPVAEDSGLILSIGEWVLRTACAQARIWGDAGSPIRIAVNMSGVQVRDPAIVDLVSLVLEESGLAPSRLELELTESTIMLMDDRTSNIFQELRELGVGLVLDDFGTGYSSLSYLRKFPITGIKIDRSFVAEIPDNENDATLAAAIVTMAQGLHLNVVGEGVEKDEQAEFLREIGCNEMQGDFIAPALPQEQFDCYLAAMREELDSIQSFQESIAATDASRLGSQPR